ncbi:unnamed protein product [Pieris macdunnoughi]|uniref:Uncharacterized protein n=1 Tax=Pieris macdunnoughi TaxID=345717 RepID=A0A821U930_9NEOP|nr:unnamed protein product [Pieris macdunnoughi]
MRFENKVVIITGANTNFGKEISVQFILEGASVVLVGKNEDKLNSLKRICDAKKDDDTQPAFVIKADLTQDDEVTNVISQTKQKFGKINILINNAEIVREGRLTDDSVLDSFDDVMSINLRAVVAITTSAAPHLIKTKGNIVNISSVGAERILGNNHIAYFISKAGLNHFTRACAMELGKKGVRVNTVSVGATSGSYSYSKSIDTHIDPEEVAELVLHAASKKSKGITGSNLVNDCGNLVAYVDDWKNY